MNTARWTAGAGLLLATTMALVSPSVARADIEQEVPTTHYDHQDGTGRFDYVHAAADVPVAAVFTNNTGTSSDGIWIASPIGVTDWNGKFLEAGWITFSSFSPDANDYPECVYPQACAYNASQGMAYNFKVNRDGRFEQGMRPFFKVFVKSSSANDRTWKTAWARNGDWNEMNTERTYGNDEMDWIAAGLEALPNSPSDAVYMTAPIRIMYTSYSDTTFGDEWDWYNHCTHSAIKPRCYTHIMSSDAGYSGCGVTKNPGQSHAPIIGSCENGAESCTKRWTIQLSN